MVPAPTSGQYSDGIFVVHLVSQVLSKLLVEPSWVHQALAVWIQSLMALKIVSMTLKNWTNIKTW